MDATLYARLRQRELLAAGEELRLGRLVALARACCAACRPGLFRRLLAVLPRRAAAAASC